MPSICSCRKPEPSTSWIVATSTLPAFMCCTKPGPSSSRVPSRTSMLIASIRRRRIARPASFATDHYLGDALLHPSGGAAARRALPRTSWRRIRLQGPRGASAQADAGAGHPQARDSRLAAKHLAGPRSALVTRRLGRWNSSSTRSPASSDQAVPAPGRRTTGEDRRSGLPSQIYVARRNHQEARSTWTLSLYTLLQITLGDPLRQFRKCRIHQALCGRLENMMQRVSSKRRNQANCPLSIFNCTHSKLFSLGHDFAVICRFSQIITAWAAKTG